MDRPRRNAWLLLSMLAGGVGALAVLWATRSTSVAPPPFDGETAAAPMQRTASPRPAAQAPPPTSPEEVVAQKLERAITRSAQSMLGLCGIHSTTSCAEGVCAVVHDIPPSPLWMLWESPTLLFAGATVEAGLPDITGCAAAIEGTETAGTEVCHYRSRIHGGTPARNMLCSAYSVDSMEGADIIAACNRTGLRAVGVDGAFDGRRANARQAGCSAE